MIRKAIFFLYLILITVLSLWPSAGLLDVQFFPHADKLIHAGMYAGFSFLMLWAWPDHLTGPRQFSPLIVVVLWGLMMEFMQQYFPWGRSFDLLDLLANAAGFLPGWILYRILTKRGIIKT